MSIIQRTQYVGADDWESVGPIWSTPSYGRERVRKRERVKRRVGGERVRGREKQGKET